MTDQKELPVSNEFITSVGVQFDTEQRNQLARYLNLHYLGDVDCNKKDENGNFVSKYPEKETEEFKEATKRLYATHFHKVKVIFDVNGNCKLELV